MSRLVASILAVTLGLADVLSAQQAAQDTTRLTVERIYASREFAPDQFGPMRWLEGGTAYTTLEAPAQGEGRDIVRYDTESGRREILVPAARLVPPGASEPLEIDGYDWSPDGTKLLIFTNSREVWRTNTRGDYWVLDRATWRLSKLGGQGPEATLMFAKFSPDGGRVGYVRYAEYNIYVEDLASGRIIPITTDGSRTTINGTFDWVYEEELDLRDGWRWSPDGASIAYWQLDATGVRDFLLINNTDSLYSYPMPVQYPKAGETNSAGRVGVASAAGAAAGASNGAPTTRWIRVPGDPRQNYIARMEWAPRATGSVLRATGDVQRGGAVGAGELVIQHLNRLQNTLQVMLVDARSGEARTVFTERDSAWVELVDPLVFANGGRDFVWVSERDGWEHIYLVSRDGRRFRPLTSGEFDVTLVAVDTLGAFVYYYAAPGEPARSYLYRARLDGRGRPERLSPANAPGRHRYNIAPNLRYAIHTYSNATTPPTITLLRLPDHRPIRTLVDNARLKRKVAGLGVRAPEFTQVDIGGGTRLNAWFIKPPAFDSTRRYPVLFYVYGGPGSQTVVDAWGGSQYLWFQMLAQRGYIVASVDNRGTGSRGRAWRKIIYGRMGVVETQDQAAAAKAVARLPFVDPARVGIWGWSYGGFMSLNAITQHPDVYKTAVAVAPVTHWRYYDTIYTERYNGLPQQNAAGYDAGSPLTYAKRLRGNLLIVHGSGDDNVHYQNTEAMVNALIEVGRPFSLMVYPNRDHSISSDRATPHLRAMLTRYIEENL
jgi:dipeptidyl-peptidase-4